jgi:phosphoribosylformimino-5-aminoimidazole carboxamide ribotide isomerase
MIQIIPSISIYGGKVVKLIQGDKSKEKVYEGSPVDVARRFEDHGLEVVHLIDLEGAAEGSAKNFHVLEALACHTNLKIDFTGGLVTDGDVNKAFEYGACYITVASASVLDKELFSSWVISYGREKVTLGADTANGKIYIQGWQKETSIDLFDHIGYFYDHGLKYVKTTDINRDGLLEGPAFDMYQRIRTRYPNLSVLAAGGVRSVQDIEKLQEMGIFAVIIGRAIYEGKLSLKDLERFLVKK